MNPYQLKYGGGDSDAFVAKLDSSGGSFDYVTYLGGNGRDPAYAIAADNNGNAYIAGNTSSTNFPMVNPYPLPPGILGGYVVVLGDQPVPPEPPVVEFSANNTLGFKPLTIQFTDQSTGHPTSWAWDFGDGSTSTLQNPVHTYTEAGVYTVSLTASNAFGTDTLVKEGYITVMGPIGGDKGFFLVHSNVEGATVLFDDVNEGIITDGTLLVEVFVTGSPFRTFTVQKCGYFTLTQNITNTPGKDETVNLYANLTAPKEPLIADFNGSPRSGTAPLSVGFTDQSIGHPETWDWNFGDGIVLTGTKSDP